MSLRRSFATACAAVAVLSLASPALAGPWGLAPGEFYTELMGSSSSTTTYRDANGDRPDLGARFEERGITAHTEFGWKTTTSFIMEMPFVSRTYAPESQGTDTYSSTGLGDILLALRYAGRTGSLPYAFELGWTAPLGTNRKLFPGSSGSGGTDPTSWPDLAARQLASDSSTFFSTGLQSLALHFDVGGAIGSKTYWAVGAGYRTRYFTFGARKEDDRYADFTNLRAEVGYWVGPQILLAGEFDGEWQASQGTAYDRIPATGPTANAPELESKNLLAGLRLTYRVDERMDVFAGSRHTAQGENVLHENYFYGGVAWKNSGLDRLAGVLGGTKAPSKAPAAPPAAPPPPKPVAAPADTTQKK